MDEPLTWIHCKDSNKVSSEFYRKKFFFFSFWNANSGINGLILYGYFRETMKKVVI